VLQKYIHFRLRALSSF